MRSGARWLAAAAGLLAGGACAAAGGSPGAGSAQAAGGIPALATRPAHLRLGFERTTLPGGEGMGLASTSYLVEWGGSGLSAGPAVYAAATGRRGGFYTFGGELAWRRRLAGPLGVGLGLYAGGGGGAGAPQGGGLMLRPHAELWWRLPAGELGLTLSRVRFPNGAIDATQLGLAWTLDVPLRHVPAGSAADRVAPQGRSGLGFDRVAIHAGAWRVRGDPARADGGALPRDVRLVDVRAERALGRLGWWGVEASGAAGGGVAGYAEYLATLGVESAPAEAPFAVGARVALGTGGGGGVPTGGGLLAKASLHARVQVAADHALAVEAGLVDAPRGELRAAQASLAWLWTLDRPEPRPPAPVARTEFAAGVGAFDAARRDGSTRALTAAVLAVRRYVADGVYLTGQAHTAVAGGAGGWSAGWVGAGVARPLAPRWEVWAELLAGAAGGGGVDTGGGALLQPAAGLAWRVDPALALQLGAGWVHAPGGRVGSPAVAVALVHAWGVAGSGR